jgi:DNA (cytosine-5)-methyltransferase 1
MHPERPAYTITGSGGGGTHGYHWSENRSLTNREKARVQTFPDDYEFVGGVTSVRKQIGMAVPPKGASVIFTSLLKSLSRLNREC